MPDEQQLEREREQRERESRESEVTKFEEVAEDVDKRREEAAQRIGEPLEPDQNDR